MIKQFCFTLDGSDAIDLRFLLTVRVDPPINSPDDVPISDDVLYEMYDAALRDLFNSDELVVRDFEDYRHFFADFFTTLEKNKKGGF